MLSILSSSELLTAPPTEKGYSPGLVRSFSTTSALSPYTGRAIILAMRVSELGEFGLIDLLAEMISTSQSKSAAAYQKLVIGIGDDAAAWKGDSSTQLATTVAG